MSSAEHTHHVPLPLEVVQEQLHSASYLKSRMPEPIRLDFRNLDGDRLVRDSEVTILTDLDALHEQWPKLNRGVTAFLKFAGLNRSLTLSVLNPVESGSRFSAFQQPIGRVGLDYEFERLSAELTATRTVLDVPRAPRAWILQLGARHLISHLLPDAVSVEPEVA